MYENLIETLRFCAKNGDCHDCPYEKPCAGTMGDGLYCEAADAIEELQKCLDGVCADNDALCEKIEELQALVRIYSGAVDETVKMLPIWISVTDRLPEEDGLYLVCGKWGSGKKMTDTCEYKSHDGYFSAAWNFDVTHWMPLPEPPKEET